MEKTVTGLGQLEARPMKLYIEDISKIKTNLTTALAASTTLQGKKP